MTVQWTVRAAEPTEQGEARGETEPRQFLRALPAAPSLAKRHHLPARAYIIQKSLLSIDKRDFLLVPLTGIEPVRCCHHGILSPGRLPVPPQRRFFFFFILQHKREFVKI